MTKVPAQTPDFFTAFLGRTAGLGLAVVALLAGLQAIGPGNNNVHGLDPDAEAVTRLVTDHDQLVDEHVALLGMAEALAMANRDHETEISRLREALAETSSMPQPLFVPVMAHVRPEPTTFGAIAEAARAIHVEASPSDSEPPSLSSFRASSIRPESLDLDIPEVSDAPGSDRLDRAYADWMETMERAIQSECARSWSALRCAAGVRSRLAPFGAAAVRCSVNGAGAPIYVASARDLPSNAVALNQGALLLCDPTL